jgi:sulfhydrogenase subunit alpha
VSHTHERDISVEALARVEGEGAMRVRIRDDHVEHVALEIYEPPRFFEALLVGRGYTEPPDLTARICGICPVAYQLSAINAIEDACGVEPPPMIRLLRRLLYCGEWIESHVLHVFLLHAPDFLGYQSAIDMAADHHALVEQGLRLRKLGNTLLEVIGGRAIHPINVRVGGFHRAPRVATLQALRPELEWARDAAIATVRAVAGFDFPDLEQHHVYVALRPDVGWGPDAAPGYPLETGRVVASDGLDIAVQEWPRWFREEHVPHSTALHGRMVTGATYAVGPQARFALNADRLHAPAAEVAAEVGLVAPERNPFRSILVRAVETVEAIDEALRLIDAYEEPERSAVTVPAVEGVGHGATEAPRGILYHRYAISAAGLVTAATIVPPTAQNQPAMEADLAGFVQRHLDLDDEALRWRSEQAIRNYDPCISCSTHFLELQVDRA